jgi:hypothetical protein
MGRHRYSKFNLVDCLKKTGLGYPFERTCTRSYLVLCKEASICNTMGKLIFKVKLERRLKFFLFSRQPPTYSKRPVGSPYFIPSKTRATVPLKNDFHLRCTWCKTPCAHSSTPEVGEKYNYITAGKRITLTFHVIPYLVNRQSRIASLEALKKKLGKSGDEPSVKY